MFNNNRYLSASRLTANVYYRVIMTEAVITPEQLETKLTEALAPDFVQAIDCSDGCGQKFEITVVSRYN